MEDLHADESEGGAAIAAYERAAASPWGQPSPRPAAAAVAPAALAIPASAALATAPETSQETAGTATAALLVAAPAWKAPSELAAVSGGAQRSGYPGEANRPVPRPPKGNQVAPLPLSCAHDLCDLPTGSRVPPGIHGHTSGYHGPDSRADSHKAASPLLPDPLQWPEHHKHAGFAEAPPLLPHTQECGGGVGVPHPHTSPSPHTFTFDDFVELAHERQAARMVASRAASCADMQPPAQEHRCGLVWDMDMNTPALLAKAHMLKTALSRNLSHLSTILGNQHLY